MWCTQLLSRLSCLRASCARIVLVAFVAGPALVAGSCGGSQPAPPASVIPPGFNDVILGSITPTVVARPSAGATGTAPGGFHRVSVLNDGIPGGYLTVGQGWVLLRVRPDAPPTANRAVFGWMKPAGKDYIELFYRPDGTIIAVRRAKGEGAGTQLGYTITKGTEFDWLMTWTPTQVRLDADGLLTQAVSNVLLPDLSDALRFEIGSALPFDDALPGAITMCAFGRGTISETESKAIHDALLAGPLSAQAIKALAPGSDPTFAWDARGPRGRTGECDP